MLVPGAASGRRRRLGDSRSGGQTRGGQTQWAACRDSLRGGRPAGLDPQIAARLKRDSRGLVTAVVQQEGTGEVLMVGWMDDEALHRTLTTGRSTFFSRSRNEYWVKGETSGHRQWVRGVRLDCDGDTVLVTVDPGGSRLSHRVADLFRRPRACRLVVRRPGPAASPR